MFNSLIVRHRAYIFLTALFALFTLFALQACSTADNGQSSQVTVAQVQAEATGALNAVKAGITAYIASVPPGTVSADVQAQIATAEAAADALITSMNTADLTTVAKDAVSVSNSLAAVVVKVPDLPPQVVAAVIAFQVFSAALQPVIDQPAPPASLAVGAVSAPQVKVVPGSVHIRLVR